MITATKPAATHQQTVLIVDDTPANLDVIVSTLEGLEVMVVVARDGEEGLRRAQFVLPDLILLDVMMPGMDGFETCRRLKMNPATREIPVIFMSALSDTPSKLSGFEAGGVDYISKPFQVEEVLARVKTHLSVRAMQLQVAAQNAQLQQAYEKIGESESRYKLLVESSPDAILVEADNRIVFANRAALKMFRASHPNELSGRSLLTLVAPESRASAAEITQEVLRGKPHRTAEELALRLDGETFAVAITRLALSERRKPALQVVARDISEHKRVQERLQYQATHDDLTSLPNRAMFKEVLNIAIHATQRYHQPFALLHVDLDRFKAVNETLGRKAGDVLLQELAWRFVQALRASDVVARLGSDEFIILLHGVPEREQCAVVARKILSLALKPVLLLGQERRVSASIGICLCPDDGADEHTLMKNLGTALYLAKEQGKNNFQFYSKDINAKSLERLTLEASLSHALERNEFVLHYQPKRDLESGQICGVEALLRWRHAELGLVPPLQFIPLAEEAGMGSAIGAWVLRAACLQNMQWQKDGLPPLCISVNVSPRQFLSEDLIPAIRGALRDSGMNPALLELEITEASVMRDAERAAELLAALRKLEVRVAIDDFGTGYSSVEQLKRFPIDTLKIDRSFVRDIPDDAEGMAVTEAIIGLGKALNLTVLAEGVETAGQEEFLRERGCQQMQGFLFSKALPAEQFAELLRGVDGVKA
jgi:diguanylate cyclase (GGDEF)-like protein/PAS domain S-box-containing protein